MGRRFRSIQLGIFFTYFVLVSGCTHDVPAINCVTPDFDCYISQATASVNVIKDNIGYWSNINLACQISVLVFGTIATLVIALQGDTNKKWTRPIGIIATTLVTGISSAVANFHVPENVDKLIDIAGKMAEAINDFDESAELLKAGKTKMEVDEYYKTDKTFREAANQLMSDFAKKNNELKMELWRIKGTAARLNPVSRNTDN